MKSQPGPVDKKCPNCGAGNPAKASRCSGCSLDFKFLGFVMKILTGAYPEAECNPDILTPGEVAHFSARISVTELRDKAHLDQGYGASKHVLAKRPCSGSFNFLATGLLVATNHRILILSGGEICSIPWEEIRQFDLDATSVRIFHQGRYSGDICQLIPGNPVSSFTPYFTDLLIASSMPKDHSRKPDRKHTTSKTPVFDKSDMLVNVTIH